MSVNKCWSTRGKSDCGAVCRAVASESRGPGFESSHL